MAGDATQLTATELQGLTELQSEFVTEQLRKVLPAGARNAVRTVEISPQFAQSVVTTDPTQLNVVALSDDLFEAVYGSEALARQAGTGAFSLTATKGTMIHPAKWQHSREGIPRHRYRSSGAVQPSGTQWLVDR
jgi:hypothetical protein